MMSGIAIKKETPILPMKTIVSVNENDSMPHQDDESRGDATITTREGDNDRDGNGNAFIQHHTHKSSPVPRPKNVTSAGLSHIHKNPQQQSSRYYNTNSMLPG